MHAAQEGPGAGECEDRGRRPGDRPEPRREREAGARSTIAIVDSHALVRDGIRLILQDSPYQVVAEAGDLAGTREMVRRHRPDILVMEARLGRESTVGSIPALVGLSPRTRVLVVTMQGDPRSACEALQAGARGYLRKDATADELRLALGALAADHYYLDAEVGASLAIQGAEPQVLGLTRRERDILTLVAEGNTNQEIAATLSWSLRTVEAQRASIRSKLGLRNRAQFVECARRYGLLT